MANPTPPFTITKATTPSNISAISTLFKAYTTWLNIDLTFQSFASELNSLPGKYAPPTGTLLLAVHNETKQPIGCVGLRPLDPASDGICEMKRLYVTPEGRGSGAGRTLAVEVVKEAKALGYRAIRLDTLKHMTAALKLYGDLGFKEIGAYYETPLEDTVFLELDLRG